MRKILGRIFGNDESQTRLVEGAVTGVDKLFFTSEEKSDARAKAGELFLRYLEATQPQNLARRLIALVVVFLWAFLILLGVASYKLDPAFSGFVFATLAQLVNEPFMIIMGFYFLAHAFRAWNDSKAGK